MWVCGVAWRGMVPLSCVLRPDRMVAGGPARSCPPFAAGTAHQGQRVHKTAMLGGFQAVERNVLWLGQSTLGSSCYCASLPIANISWIIEWRIFEGANKHPKLICYPIKTIHWPFTTPFLFDKLSYVRPELLAIIYINWYLDTVFTDCLSISFHFWHPFRTLLIQHVC